MSNTIRTIRILVAGVALAAAFAAPLSQAGVAVIVNPNVAITNADKAAVKKLFLGKAKSISGKNFKPVDQGDSEVRKKFYTVVVGKSSSQLRAYWSRLIFTGKGTPPKEIGSDADVVKAVAADPNLIGYVDSSAVDSSVTVVLTVD